MNIVQVELTDEQTTFVAEQTTREGYTTVGDYLLSLVKAAQKKRAWEIAEQLVLEGLKSPARPMTKEDWQQLHERIHQATAVGDGKS